jgi:ABC-type Fe3+-hydroxamate transport system substrate-binding protein
MTGGNGHAGFHPGFEHPEPLRIVSLVPSVTESLFDLGMGPRVVGITDYCVHPAEALAGLPRLGGPKNPQLDALLALQPDLVIVNQEENTPQTVDALQAVGIRVWLTFPKSVAEAMDVLWALVRIQPDDQAVMRLRVLEQALSWTEEAAALQAQPRYFCPVWFETTTDGVPWWMVFNRHTYAHDLLALVGGQNIFADRERLYPLDADLGRSAPAEPGTRDTRYPRITLEELRAGDPQVILLPSEPFSFTEEHLRALADMLPDTAAVRDGRLHLVDGSLITWHGTRLGSALQELPKYFYME